MSVDALNSSGNRCEDRAQQQWKQQQHQQQQQQAHDTHRNKKKRRLSYVNVYMTKKNNNPTYICLSNLGGQFPSF